MRGERFHWHREFGRGFRRRGPFGPFGGGPFDEGGRKRQRRGDIKFILLEMIKEQPRHGYELIKELEQRYGGFYRPSPGSVYPTLQMLEDEGHLRSEVVDGKRVYTITDSGRALLDEREHEPGEQSWGWQQRGFWWNRPQIDELRRSMMALIESVMQTARYGTEEQAAAVRDLLAKTNQEVHSILAKGKRDPETL
jgi:DNA-binding PadR family transcriptional regulator